MQEPLIVTSTAFQRGIGDIFWRDVFIDQRTVVVTRHGRTVGALLPPQAYERYRRWRQEHDAVDLAAARLWEVTL